MRFAIRYQLCEIPVTVLHPYIIIQTEKSAYALCMDDRF